MKVIILAGGKGTRLAEETASKPKPMIKIGEMPIIWHIIKIYSHFGFDEFVICCGHKGGEIKKFFSNYLMSTSDLTINMSSGVAEYHVKRAEPWRITLVDTGEETMTGGRLLRVAPYIQDQEAFFFTYGDGVGDIDIGKSLEFHRSHGKKATITAAYPPPRFGALSLDGNLVSSFEEKPAGDGGRVNAGFFILHPSVLNLIAGDETTWEQEPLKALASQDELMAYRHDGFWQPMDTLRDMTTLNELWCKGSAPWKVWE